MAFSNGSFSMQFLQNPSWRPFQFLSERHLLLGSVRAQILQKMPPSVEKLSGRREIVVTLEVLVLVGLPFPG